MLAIDILKWPGMNVAFLTALFVTLALTFAVIPFGKRRPVGTPVTWGEAMLGSTYVFLVLFLAYGVVPNQWLLHVQNGLGWRADKILLGPGQILKAQSTCNPDCGQFPFTINYLQVGDAIVTMIYIAFLGLQIYMFSWWQKRGKKAPSTEVETSTYGRPLVKKAYAMARTDANPPMPEWSNEYQLVEVDADYLTKAVKPKQFIHIDQSECIMCEGCVDICPWKCIHMVTPDAVAEADGTEQPGEDPSDKVIFIIDDDVCTRCALCVDRCPTGVIILGKAGAPARTGDFHQRTNNHGYAYGLRL